MIITKEVKHIEKVEMLYSLHGGKLEDCNFFGISNTEGLKLSVWNDPLGLYDKKNGIVYLGEGTCSPSKWWTLNHGKGVDHLMPGWYKRIWALGNHKGHLALVQGARKISTIRDANRNFEIDPSDEIVTDKAWWGIDMHTTYRPIRTLGIIGQASAGCQVWKYWQDFEEIIKTVKKSGQELFSYLLMLQKEENGELYKLVYR